MFVCTINVVKTTRLLQVSGSYEMPDNSTRISNPNKADAIVLIESKGKEIIIRWISPQTKARKGCCIESNNKKKNISYILIYNRYYIITEYYINI